MERLNLIGSEEITALEEVEQLNMFTDVKERVEFRLAVCAPAKCRDYSAIDENSFEECYELARELLRIRGRAILSTRSKWAKLPA